MYSICPKYIDMLTLYLLMLSADNFCKQFGPKDQSQQNVEPDLEPNCLTL